MKDFDGKMRGRDEKIMFIKREIEQGKKQNAELMQNNSALQAEIDSMSSHIRVVTH